MELIKNIEKSGETCGFIKQHSARNLGRTHKTVCGKPATYVQGSKYLCCQHSGRGRFVLRNGDVGEILARYDTEQELQNNAHLYPDAVLQKITNSHRKTILRKEV